MVCIPGDPLTKLCMHYLDGHIEAFDVMDFPVPEEEPDREEVRFIRRAMLFSGQVRRKGLLSAEDMLDKGAITNRDIFEYGMRFVIDGESEEYIEKILTNLVNHETDPWKKNLRMAKKIAVLSIYKGDSPRILALKLLSCFGADIQRIVESELLKD
jgi:flagellar motor component MotA